MNLEDRPMIPKAGGIRAMRDETGKGPATYHKAVAAGKVKPHIDPDTEREHLSMKELRKLIEFAEQQGTTGGSSAR